MTIKFLNSKMHCDLSLIALPVSDINISQGSVVTRVKYGGIFNYRLTANIFTAGTKSERI